MIYTNTRYVERDNQLFEVTTTTEIKQAVTQDHEQRGADTQVSTRTTTVQLIESVKERVIGQIEPYTRDFFAELKRDTARGSLPQITTAKKVLITQKVEKGEVIPIYPFHQIVERVGDVLTIHMDRFRQNVSAYGNCQVADDLGDNYVFTIEKLRELTLAECEAWEEAGDYPREIRFEQLRLQANGVENFPVNPRPRSAVGSARPVSRTRSRTIEERGPATVAGPRRHSSRTGGSGAMPRKALFGASRKVPVWESSREVRYMVNALKPIRMKAKEWTIIPVEEQIPEFSQGIRAVFSAADKAPIDVYDRSKDQFIVYNR